MSNLVFGLVGNGDSASEIEGSEPNGVVPVKQLLILGTAVLSGDKW